MKNGSAWLAALIDKEENPHKGRASNPILISRPTTIGNTTDTVTRAKSRCMSRAKSELTIQTNPRIQPVKEPAGALQLIEAAYGITTDLKAK